jgi:hypothetical protein
MKCEELIIGDCQQPLRIIQDIEYLRSILNATNNRSLVVFDIDNTLIVSEDPYDRGYLKDRIQAHTIEALTLSQRSSGWFKDSAKRIVLASRARLLKKSILVHDALPGIIQDLHDRHVTTIGLTNCYTGRYGCISSVEDWRAQVLKDLGIEFDSSFPTCPQIIFEQLRKSNKVPTFKHGILFTGHICSKGQLLMNFLRHMGNVFDNAICIDDQEDMLASEFSALKAMSIPCNLVRYIAAFSMPQKFDLRVAEYQLQYLIDRDTWLTGEQAQALLEECDQMPCCCLIQ